MPSHPCNYCEKTFSAPSLLIAHERVHTGERPFQCQVCLKSFKQKPHLVNHMRSHTGASSFKCSFCQKAFRYSCQLREHMYDHTGKWPHKCDICGHGFKRSTNLRGHMKVHLTTEPRFYCHVCNNKRRWFKSESALDLHMRNNHTDFPSPQVTINTQVLPVGTVSCITHTSVTETGVVTAVSRISSPVGSVIFTQTTNTSTSTSAITSTITSTSTSATIAQPNPVETATVSQSSEASVSWVEFPLNPVVDTEEPLLGLDEILTTASSDFSSWQLDNP